MKLLLLTLGLMTATSCKAPFGPVVNHYDTVGITWQP